VPVEDAHEAACIYYQPGFDSSVVARDDGGTAQSDTENRIADGGEPR
jgi:hypothetical protein